MVAYVADGGLIRDLMQKAEISSSELLLMIAKRAESESNTEGIGPLTATQLSDMLAERHRFREPAFIAVAKALMCDDHMSLTRRNGSVCHLESVEEKKARMELSRLIHLGAIPVDVDDLKQYLLNGIATSSLPGALAEYDVSAMGYGRVLDSLCPAGVLHISGEKYRILPPSTNEALTQTLSRLGQLKICVRLIYGKETGGAGLRRVISDHMKPYLKTLQKTIDRQEYMNADVDWQLEMSGGDRIQYRHMLIATRSYRFTIDHLFNQREHNPNLVFQEDFDMDYRDWYDKMREHNVHELKKLIGVLHDEESTEKEARDVVVRIVDLTLLQLRVLDNAKEHARGTRSDRRRYSNLKWPTLD